MQAIHWRIIVILAVHLADSVASSKASPEDVEAPDGNVSKPIKKSS
jgi:hypothetical protein